jgi:Capsule assembly protein Wzi
MARLTVRLLLLYAGFTPSVCAQASAYIPLDDPRLPAFEHLVAMGDVPDPSPFVRPFRRADALRMLDAALAHGAARDTELVGELRRAWREDSSESHWRLEGRAGFQAYSDARADPLHPAGPKGVRPYVDLGLSATFGGIVLVSRPAIETRLLKDPDWPGRKNLQVTGRQVEAYLSAQFKHVRLYYGQMDQNWGPAGVPGIGLSNYGYPHPHFGLEIGNETVRLSAQASTLADQSDSTGQIIHRYFFAHRLDARFSRRFRIGLWETVVLGGPDRGFDARYRNPVSLLLLANEYGLGDQGNLLLGLDVSWRPTERVTLQGQFGLDDLQYQHHSGPDRTPNRYAFTLMGTGPLAGRVAWRALYTQASSLAFRTSNPVENFTDQGVGLGRNFAGNDQFTLILSSPIRRGWLLSPQLTLLRQGEGDLNTPFPTGAAKAATPTLFIGTVERTWRAALGVSGREGPIAIQGDAGLHYVENPGHVAGRSKTRFAGRVQVTLALGRAHPF